LLEAPEIICEKTTQARRFRTYYHVRTVNERKLIPREGPIGGRILPGEGLEAGVAARLLYGEHMEITPRRRP
jgi:hypothetical protein